MIGRKYIIRINGDKWHYIMLDPGNFVKKHEDFAARTYSEKKLIVFNSTQFRLNTVIHELVHGCFKKICLSDTHSINIDDFEEIAATFTETYAFDIIETALKIYTKYKPEHKNLAKDICNIFKQLRKLK